MLSIYGRAVGVTVPALSEPLMALNRPVVTAFGVEGRPAGAATSVYRLMVCTAHTINLYTDVAAPAGLPSTPNAVTTGLFNAINGSLSAGTVTPTALPYIDNIVFPVQSPVTYWLPTVRVDYNINDNLRMYVSWNMTKWKQPGAGAPPFPGAAFKSYGASNQFEYFTAALGFDWTIKPTIVNQFRGGYLFNLAKYSYDARSEEHTSELQSHSDL